MSNAAMICSVSELIPNQAMRVEVDGVAIAVVQDSAGEIHAIGDTCTHGEISLSEASSRARASNAGRTAPSSRSAPARR
ncbi:Biphenyl dioxygenase ferredoxin subunit [Rathayibacter tanaceti]|uniref:Biphenyl dioxygenase ferredoxin subunit n=1 Tax=Rathayibacter tanaceti TaxID=1671680 RepID=A0A166IH90_9MICO|nr:Biphenyl dioxygenase ferredoxin subunit [Rathayibacter tanaceti]